MFLDVLLLHVTSVVMISPTDQYACSSPWLPIFKLDNVHGLHFRQGLLCLCNYHLALVCLIKELGDKSSRDLLTRWRLGLLKGHFSKAVVLIGVLELAILERVSPAE
jgi:hypothetical protein